MKIDEIRADRIDSGGAIIAIAHLAGKTLPWPNTLSTYRDGTAFSRDQQFRSCLWRNRVVAGAITASRSSAQHDSQRIGSS